MKEFFIQTSTQFQEFVHRVELHLFDSDADPSELNSLADDPAYSEKSAELRGELERWMTATGGQPNLPEKKLVKQLWNGNDSQSITADPIVASLDGNTTISCATDGASVGYQDSAVPKTWSIYQKPFPTPKGSVLQVKAHRIDFQPSNTITVNLGANEVAN